MKTRRQSLYIPNLTLSSFDEMKKHLPQLFHVISTKQKQLKILHIKFLSNYPQDLPITKSIGVSLLWNCDNA